jgi:hypothetical protein
MTQETITKIIDKVVEGHSTYQPSLIEFMPGTDSQTVIANARAGSRYFRVEISEAKDTIRLFELHGSRSLKGYMKTMSIE